MYPKPYTAVILALFCWQAVAAQTPLPDNRKPAAPENNKGPSVRERAQEARFVLREMAQFPAEVRDAIPIVALQPDLPGKLTDLAKKDDVAYINEILAKYPKDVQAAVRALLPWPKAMEFLAMHTNLLRMFGEIAKKDGIATVQTIMKELETEDAQTDASATAWAKRLNGNKTAVYRYIEAMTAYAQEKPKAEFLDYRYGFLYTAKGNAATVYAMPPAPFTTYVFVNADLYPELADEMMEQWLQTDSRTDFDDVMHRAWVVYRQVFTDDFFRPEGRADRLRAAALLGKKLGDGFKEGKITLLLNNPNVGKEAANLTALQQFVRKEGVALAQDQEKPKVPRKTEAVANNNLPLEKPAQVAKVPNNQPAEPSPGEPAAPPPVNTPTNVWYWYQNNLPATTTWADTPFLNGFTPLFFGSLRLPPLPRHPQAPPDTPVTPSGSTGTTIQDEARAHPAFRRPPFVPDPLNRGGASSGNQPRIPGGVSVPANTTPTDPTISSVGTVNPGTQNPSGTTGQTQSGTAAQTQSGTGATNATALNRGGSTMQRSPVVPGMNPGTGSGTSRNSAVNAPPTFVRGPGDDWKRFPSMRPPGWPFPAPGTGGGTNPGTGVGRPGTGGGLNNPVWIIPMQRPGWWRGMPVTPIPNRPAVPAAPKR